MAVLDKTKVKLKDITKYWWVAIRSGLIGVGIGIIPGVGEDVASWTSYGVAKRSSKHPEEYGKGSIEGLVAAETADNSCIGGAIIPLLSMGIPGSPPAAVMLGAFLIHGVRPGPMLSFEFPAFTYQAVSWLLVATIFMRFFAMWLARPMQKILQVKSAILMPIVTVLCAIGAYSLDIRFIDIAARIPRRAARPAFQAGKIPGSAAGARHRPGAAGGHEFPARAQSFRRRHLNFLHTAGFTDPGRLYRCTDPWSARCLRHDSLVVQEIQTGGGMMGLCALSNGDV